MCIVLKISRSGYYSWLQRGLSDRSKRDSELLEKIRSIHSGSDETYGSPRVHSDLVTGGEPCGRKRVARLMREDGIRSKIVKKHKKPQSTNSNHKDPVFPNLLPDQRVERPDQVWVADMTYLRVGENWCYLAAILDLFLRRIVGWSVGQSPNTALTLAALTNALSTREAPELHHSDRGCQYAAAYRDALQSSGIEGSMSRKGNCYDNATMESFFGTLKTERVFHEEYSTLDELRGSLFNYIEMFYNTQRLHSSIGYKSPAELEKEIAA